ncbi:MAG: T9SS C-terminal target domain-containing protein [Calditrichaeota bacterium]|nr:MAG: T9SS C-terminal target domain-containing protein [Calditrichota bacterium]
MVSKAANQWQLHEDVFPDSTRFMDAGISPTDSLFCIFLKNGDVFLAGNDRVTSVSRSPVNTIPEAYALEQNYPNPFNPATTIRFALPERSHVILKLYDLLGREVTTLVDEKLPPGEYGVVFEAQDLPSGVYFYRIKAEGFVKTRKLTLLK